MSLGTKLIVNELMLQHTYFSTLSVTIEYKTFITLYQDPQNLVTCQSPSNNDAKEINLKETKNINDTHYLIVHANFT